MTIRKVAQLGHPVLREKARPIEKEAIKSPAIQTLIDDMIQTKEEYVGIGLAAPQVHEPLQLIVVGLKDNPRYPDAEQVSLRIVINPKITGFSTDMDEDWESCLSVDNLSGLVKRATQITVAGLDREGNDIEINAEGFEARVYQHEIDHLHGKVFLDRMSDLKSLCFGKEFSKFAKLYEPEEEAGDEEQGL
ncbi:Peptide deformylase [hydrothermal vent metagenome]|uniref:Peptide deformylase n=1 Tax=hydrothermal vent metagenome TaxID=652676 RepID=A0A3B1BWM9_9ZZZZ